MNQYLMPAALSVALMAPLAAHAVTTQITANNVFGVMGSLAPQGTATFVFTATEALNVDALALTAQGTAEDVLNVTFQVTASDGTVIAQPLTPFASFTPGDFFGSGTSNFALDLNLFNGDALTVIFNDGIQNNVGLLVALATSEVPLPAAGGMLLTGLAAAGFVARRKKKTAA